MYIIINMKKQKSNYYRLYSFTNNYISSLQKGLQTAHLVSNLFSAYTTKSKEKDVLYKWANDDKTIIILSGGNQFDLQLLFTSIARLATDLKLPSGSFNEDKASLNGATTAVGLIIPKDIYDMNLLTADDGDYPERELKELLSKYRLAI